MRDTPRLDSFVELLRSKFRDGDVTPVNDDDPDLEQADVTANLAVFPDDGPKSGTWVDVDEVIAHPTPEEIEEGRLLGEGIDIDDDDDTGVRDG